MLPGLFGKSENEVCSFPLHIGPCGRARRAVKIGPYFGANGQAAVELCTECASALGTSRNCYLKLGLTEFCTIMNFGVWNFL